MNYLMVSITLFVVVSFGTVCWAQESRPKGSGTVRVTEKSSLAEVVARLNDDIIGHPIGKNQTPITVDEIVAVIRRHLGSKIPKNKRNEFLAVATTEMLNSGDWLKYSTESWTDEFHFTVWSIELTVGGYKIRIRDRAISSRAQTPLEKTMRQHLKKQLEKAMQGKRV